MDIKAFKMDGLGNDFVIIDNRQKITNLSKEQIIKICDREFIGCDQLILINKNMEFIDNDLPIGKYWMNHPWFIAGIGIINKKELKKCYII